MQDFIPNGTGNSRYLKSVASFLTDYPNYAAFAAALIAGTLPLDLNGVNPSGYSQLGTPLNKANLLDDATATALELSDQTVNGALLKLNERAKIQVVTYVGDGTYGSSNPNTLAFDFKPQIVFIAGDPDTFYGIYIQGVLQAYPVGSSASSAIKKVSWSGNNLSWYAEVGYGDNAPAQQNVSGKTYHAVAFG